MDEVTRMVGERIKALLLAREYARALNEAYWLKQHLARSPQHPSGADVRGLIEQLERGGFHNGAAQPAAPPSAQPSPKGPSAPARRPWLRPQTYLLLGLLLFFGGVLLAPHVRDRLVNQVYVTQARATLAHVERIEQAAREGVGFRRYVEMVMAMRPTAIEFRYKNRVIYGERESFQRICISFENYEALADLWRKALVGRSSMDHAHLSTKTEASTPQERFIVQAWRHLEDNTSQARTALAEGR